MDTRVETANVRKIFIVPRRGVETTKEKLGWRSRLTNDQLPRTTLRYMTSAPRSNNLMIVVVSDGKKNGDA